MSDTESHPAVDVPDTSTLSNPTIDDAQPYHRCHQQCNLLGCFVTAPWVELIQNGQDEQCCAYELLQLLLLPVDSSSGLGRVLCAARVAFERADRGRVRLLDFKEFLDAL